MSSARWEPLPHDVAERRGRDADTVPFVLDLATVSEGAGLAPAPLASGTVRVA